jgi:hypothetical protein
VPSLRGVRAVRPHESAEDPEHSSQHRGSTGVGRLPSGFATLRDLISFIGGLAIIANEVFISASVEAYAVGVGVAMMGLPLVFGADERKSR